MSSQPADLHSNLFALCLLPPLDKLVEVFSTSLLNNRNIGDPPVRQHFIRVACANSIISFMSGGVRSGYSLRGTFPVAYLTCEKHYDMHRQK